MLKLLLLLVLPISSSGLFAQHTYYIGVTPDSIRLFEIFEVDAPPVFPGGDTALMSYLMKSMPEQVVKPEEGIPGTLVFSFVINDKGKVEAVSLKNAPGTDWEKRMMVVFEKMPNWNPGKVEGRAVNVRYSLPLRIHWE